MNKKLLLLRNRTPYDTTADLAYFTVYMKRHGINLDISMADIDIKGYTSQWMNLAQGGRWILQGALALCNNFVDKTDDVAMLLVNGYTEFGNDAPSGSERGIMANNHTYFTNVEMDYASEPNGLVKVEMCHEFMHYLIDDANHKGFNIVDPMDIYIDEQGVQHLYWNNFNPDALQGNFAIAWKRLYDSGYLVDPNTLLKIGSSGIAVQNLQTDLGLRPDGLFGQQTKSAVIKFQAQNNLLQDGVVGPKTMEILNAKKKV